MYNRMMVAVRDLPPDETSGKFGLVLMRLGFGEAGKNELVCTHDSYALCDYWATMYNIGHADVDKCREALSVGMESMPSFVATKEIGHHNHSNKPLVEQPHIDYGNPAQPKPQQPEEDGGDGNYR